MHIEEIFYGIFWISAVSAIWFYTDWLIHYTQLFGLAEKTRLLFQDFVQKNPGAFFSEFIYTRSLLTNNPIKKFVYKLISCPFCLLTWFSLIYGAICGNFLICGPVYVGSLLITLQIKRMI